MIQEGISDIHIVMYVGRLGTFPRVTLSYCVQKDCCIKYAVDEIHSGSQPFKILENKLHQQSTLTLMFRFCAFYCHGYIIKVNVIFQK